MKRLVLAALFCAPAFAQVQFQVYSTGQVLSAATPYQFSDTAVGSSTSITVRMTNTSGATLPVNTVFIGASPTSSASVPGFTISGAPQGLTLASGESAQFSVTFAPVSTGPLSAYLLWQSMIGGAYSVVSPLQGTGLGAVLQLTCQDSIAAQCDGSTVLQPGNPTPLNFGPTGAGGGVQVGSSYAITFTLTNSSTAAIATPSVSVVSSAYNASVFSVNTSSLPTQIPANSSASFTVTFTPQPNFAGTSTTVTGTLVVATNSYSISGIETGAPGSPAGGDPLQVKCAYQQTSQPCPGNSVQLGPDPSTLAITISVINPNPAGSVDNDITLQSLPSISGAGFAISTATLALTSATSPGPAVTSAPFTIPAGYTLTFTVTFSGSAAATATLNIATGISYTLSGNTYPGLGSQQSDLPGLTLMCGSSPCTSQTFASQQTVPATLQVSTASSGSVNLAMTFQPYSSLPNDPAITFITPYNVRALPPIFFTSASTTGAFQTGVSQFSFQTGTTAGTIAITATDTVTLQTLTWSIDVPPAPVKITSITATRADPNLIVNIAGYDNSFSINGLSFNFASTAGTLTAPPDTSCNGAAVGIATCFHSYFFSSSNTTGGGFSLQATFPISGGSVTAISSVTATFTSNVPGQTTATEPFQ